MPTNDEGGASAPSSSGDKSRRSVPVPVCSGVGGIVLLGGFLAVGIVAGALVKIRRRRTRREIHPRNDDGHELSGKIPESSGEESGSGQSSPELEKKKMEELKKWEETEAESAEITEEIEPSMEVEPMHILIESISVKDWENKNGSISVKERDSPRSHFSFSECPSVDRISVESSDSDDFSEVAVHNKYRCQRNEQMDAKADCNPQEEETTSGQVGDEVCSDSSMGQEVLESDKEYCGAKESFDPKLEYEESVGSVDGFEEFSNVNGLEQQTEGKEGSVGNTSKECNFEQKGMDPSMGSVCFAEEDCQQDRVDAEELETEYSPRVDVHLSNEICYSLVPAGSQESETLKENAGLDQDECQQAIIDSRLQERVDSSCDVYCKKEQCSEGVIVSEVSQDFGVGMRSYNDQQGQDEGVHTRESDESKKIMYLICNQRQHEIDGFEETEFTGEDARPRQEHCLREENFDSNEKQCSEEGIGSEESQESERVTACNEPCQYGTVDSNESEGLDDVGLVNELCELQPGDLRESEILEEDPYIEKAQCQNTKIDLMDDRSLYIGLEEEFPVLKEESQQLKIDLKEPEEATEHMFVTKEHCEEETIDSKEREHIQGNAPICNELCELQPGDLRESEFLEEDPYIEKAQCQNTKIDLMDDRSLYIGLEEEFPVLKEELQQLKIDLKEPEEATEHMSVMKEHCEEETIDSKEREHIEGNAPICREKCQEEVVNLKKSQNLNEDIVVYKNELCDEKAIESKGLEDAEDITILEEQCQEKRADSNERHDSVDDIPVNNEECQELSSEIEKMEDAEEDSHKEECKEVVDADDTKTSENVHTYVEGLCQRETVDSKQSENLQGNFSPCSEQCQLEIVNSVKDNVREDLCKEQCQKEYIDFQESEYSNGDATFVSEQWPNDSVGPQDCEANSQTYNKPEEVDSESSEYSSGEQHQPETVNPEKTHKDDKETPQIYNEGKGVDASEAEYPSEDTSLINEPKEVEQDVTTTSMPESCKKDGVLEGFQMNNESTDKESDTTLATALEGSIIPNSLKERVKNRWHQMGSSLMDLKSEEYNGYPAMLLDRPLPVKIKFIVSLFAGLLLFLLVCEIVRISISIPAS